MSTPPRAAVVEREQRWSRRAGAAALIAVALVIASVVVQQIGLEVSDTDAERLEQFHDHAGQLIAADALRNLGFALFSLPLYFLFTAARSRSERVRNAFGAFAFIGPILFAIAGIILVIGLNQAASDFVDTAGEQECARDVEQCAEDTLEDSGSFQFGRALQLPAILGLIFAMVYIPLWAMRTGLVTRFWATLGMALGVSLLLLPFQLVAILLILWFTMLGLLLIGRWPGGRPPAWEAGVAIPWPKPGEAPAEPEAVEGSGREVAERPLPEDGAGDAGGEPSEPPRKRKRRR